MLTVLSRAASYVRPDGRGKKTQFLAQCDCGSAPKVVWAEHLTRKTDPVRSCGCKMGKITHGLSKTREYGIWENVIQRCTNSKAPNYRYYGEVGVQACDRWRYGEDGKGGFECFIEDVGIALTRVLRSTVSTAMAITSQAIVSGPRMRFRTTRLGARST